jgi:predicted dithiol-disulfide oxidoreductase (DUF899 family)
MRTGTREEWLAARKELLAKEEATRVRDALSAQRRELPMVEVEKAYPRADVARPGAAGRQEG